MDFPVKATLNVHGELTPEQAERLMQGLKAIKGFEFHVNSWTVLPPPKAR